MYVCTRYLPTTRPIREGGELWYFQVLNDIYGTLKAAFLFYKKLSNDLVEQGFSINPYDICVANKIINGHQMTVVWYVDNMKISHKILQEVSVVIEDLKAKCQDEIGKIKVSRGKIHDYLGTTLDYRNPGEVNIDMAEYI